MLRNGPGSIFTKQSHEQVLFNALYKMLKKLKLVKDRVLFVDQLESVYEWFESRSKKFGSSG